MSLSQNGRVQLRIYDYRGLLRIARPFDSAELAESWYAQWIKSQTPDRRPNLITYKIIAMVPAI